ncbi:RimJ/RimL family protein N-acetyltransferase [Motilibacter peucedani]|uniref:RimJ/RimL family protein N-acetyltransferase n=1 Tax=Motilibacter peucedani TaxID=598650 RepID=A0A420XRK0_9ACTN|nr:GNAT family protein [Motilibacter peucedani]RKS77460.1 RimJ/RimL family protein N-acetyltransferase [Motilibacter peucedani]
MLRGERMVLREFRREDVEARFAEQGNDWALHAVADDTAWRPRTLEQALARYDRAGSSGEPDPAHVWFTICRAGDPELAWVGDSGLWGLNEHQGTAHIGIALSRSARGEGLSTEVLRLLGFYAFRIRHLHRLSLETLGSNVPMQRAALAAGFVHEGTDRESAYVLGACVDELRFGLLASEWREHVPAAT